MIEFKSKQIELEDVGFGLYKYSCSDADFDSADGKFFTVVGVEIFQFAKKTNETLLQPEEFEINEPVFIFFEPISFDLESGERVEFDEKELKDALIKAIEIL